MISKVTISVRSLATTKDEAYGRRFIEKIIQTDPKLEPEFFDCDLAQHNTTPFESIEHALQNWAKVETLKGAGYHVKDGIWGSKWKRKNSPKYEAHFNHSRINIKNERNPSSLHWNANWFPEISWSKLFHSLCGLEHTQIAMLHLVTDVENFQDKRVKRGHLGALWSPGFVDISWGMMFGEGFADKINPDLLEEHGFPVYKLASGYLVTVTEDLQDVENDFETFAYLREVLRGLLPISVFIDKEAEKQKRIEFLEAFKEFKAKQGIEINYDPDDF